MSDAAMDGAQPTLLFIPDISGFTKFVKATDINHGGHIISELLESLISANHLGMTVAEVEGDAILFYRTGPAPTAEQLSGQVREMFLRFHAYLKRYESQRICRCGACSAAHGLTLKFVAHYGKVSQTQVQGHRKLFGEDVILVHRLLKNNLQQSQYALVTQSLSSQWAGGFQTGWAPAQQGTEDYDVGTVSYSHAPLQSLLAEVPAPSVADYGVPGVPVHVVSVEQQIDAPMEAIFENLIELPLRQQWIEGVKEVQLKDHALNRVGTRHRCLVDATSPTLVTSEVRHAQDQITFCETDEKKLACAVFVLKATGPGSTKVSVDFLRRDTFFARVLFGLLMKKKLARTFTSNLGNLKRLCEIKPGDELQNY